MAVNERAWHDAFEALAAAIGREEAGTLMARWVIEPVTRDDLVLTVSRLDARIDAVEHRLGSVEQRLGSVEQRLEAKIEAVEQRLEARIEASEHRVIGAMRGEMNAQVRSMLFGFVGLQVAIGSFVIGLLRFGL